LQKQYRLCRNRQFSYAYHRGTRASCKDLTLIYAKNTHKRVGFSVSKKVGGAVIRNLVKRRLRECVRPMLKDMRSGFYVIIAHPSCADRTYMQLKTCVDAMIRKLSPVQQDSRGG
jgi:ribonuclease P protein component